MPPPAAEASRKDAPPAAAVEATLRRRLEGLMLFRVVLVTLFFGGALVINVNTLTEGLWSTSNAAIMTLIVSTYVLTIVYALVLRAGHSLLRLARVQLALDMAVTAALVLATGGLRSVFVFLFLIVVFNAALVAGRRAALVCALALVPLLVALAALNAGLLPAEHFPEAFGVIAGQAAAGHRPLPGERLRGGCFRGGLLVGPFGRAAGGRGGGAGAAAP